MTNCTPRQLELQGLGGGRRLVAAFDGGRISSEGRLPLLAALEPCYCRGWQTPAGQEEGELRMRRQLPPAAAALVVAALLAGCDGPRVNEADNRRPAPTQSQRPPDAEDEDARLDAAGMQRYQQVFAASAHLQPVLDLMAESQADARLDAAVAELRSRPGIVAEVVALYDALTSAAEQDFDAFAEARWRTVHLLGLLQLEEATAPLHRIATTPLSDPERAGDIVYATEFRIRARAIAGLERLRAVDELQRIHRTGGVLRGVAAAALYELGRAPAGVQRLDPDQVFGPGDAADFKPADRAPDPLRPEIPEVPQREPDERVVPETRESEQGERP